MRVVAGRFGGRRLRAPPGRETRPTSDRVREALFATLGPLDGARVLDLFAGSGALAIEALSRGAASAVLVERDRRAAACARANLDALGLAEPEARLVVAPARTALKDASARAETYDLVLLDPPYRHAPALGRELSEALPPLLADGARVVTESDRRAPLELKLALTHERRYGDTLIRIHAP
ncbi:MAG TPA: 16S rRNA (guanine(966)-N(2))-methyltransferase RsmD [Solirubrobacteraceae bacterium]|nr:16S rRNA (guanine(966)-N(2))-methyltransferase RsmD [Solirubrobacteraceae bacterium]